MVIKYSLKRKITRLQLKLLKLFKTTKNYEYGRK